MSYEQADGNVYNTALAFDPEGELVATYRKIMPWMPYENTTPGDSLTVFEIPGVGKVGLIICFDAWVPEITRNLAWMGAELILQPTYTRTNDRDLELVLTRANAITNPETNKPHMIRAACEWLGTKNHFSWFTACGGRTTLTPPPSAFLTCMTRRKSLHRPVTRKATCTMCHPEAAA